MQARLPWFMEARPSAACAKGGAGAYSDALQRNASDPGGIAGLQRGVIAASAFRTSYVPLSRQTDFIDGLKVGTARAGMSLARSLCVWRTASPRTNVGVMSGSFCCLVGCCHKPSNIVIAIEQPAPLGVAWSS